MEISTFYLIIKLHTTSIACVMFLIPVPNKKLCNRLKTNCSEKDFHLNIDNRGKKILKC